MRAALHATVHFYGDVVDEVFVPRGERLLVGPGGDLSVAAPERSSFLVRARWKGGSVELEDGAGRTYELRPQEALTFRFGATEVGVRWVERRYLRRTSTVAWAGTMALLVFMVALFSSGSQATLVYEHRCELAVNEWMWRKLACPVVIASMGSGAGGNGGGHYWDAEYLERLLRRDYEGDEVGALEVNRPRIDRQAPSFYMPAGNVGPYTKMGGAEEVAPEPVRSAPDEVVERPKPSRAADLELLSVENGTPIEMPTGDAAKPNEAVAVPEKGEGEVVSDLPAEEQVGWGIPDWYDASDAAMENLEIRVMLEHSQRRLKVNPDDMDALSILSYYQYLAMDYGGAEKTYDRQINLAPDDSAAYNNKALIYKRRGQYEIEEAFYRKALALSPNDVTALNNLAVCLAHQRRFEEALQVMRDLEVLDPGNPYADLHRSKIYAEMGDDAQAFAYLDRALAGMERLDTLHHIEFRQDIRVDPSFSQLRDSYRFRSILVRYYGKDSPVREEG